MAVLTAKQRNRLPNEVFAIPEKRKYPIQDVKHARNALARVSQHGTPAEQYTVREAVYSRYPQLNRESDGTRHFAAVGKNIQTGEEGLAMVDANSPAEAVAKLSHRGVKPYQVPVQQSLNFGGGTAITKVHDDGDITAKIKGQKVVLTTEGEAFKEVSPAERANIRKQFQAQMQPVRSSLLNKLGRDTLRQRTPIMPKRIRMHRTKDGTGLTRRSDR